MSLCRFPKGDEPHCCRQAEVGRTNPVPLHSFHPCTDTLRRKEIVHLPYIKRFMVNIAGERRGGIRPVAFIPDDQMAKLRRMVGPVL